MQPVESVDNLAPERTDKKHNAFSSENDASPSTSTGIKVSPEVSTGRNDIEVMRTILSDLMTSEYAEYFNVMALPGVINPMDLKTMQIKVNNRLYGSLLEFAADMRLIFNNCFQYCSQTDEMINRSRKLSYLFEIAYFGKLSDETKPKKVESNSNNVELISTTERDGSADAESDKKTDCGIKKPFHCENCSHKFATKFGLTRHINNTHNRSTPFACSICNKRFGQKVNMKRHESKMHRKDSENEE